jgi:hypothetical protein
MPMRAAKPLAQEPRQMDGLEANVRACTGHEEGVAQPARGPLLEQKERLGLTLPYLYGGAGTRLISG